MRICFIAPADSAHTIKWCKWFSRHGHEVHVISFANVEIEGVFTHTFNANVDAQGTDLKKIKYLTYAKKVRRIVMKIQPDVVNVHYATSYGTTVALSGIRGYVLSIWGSDVYSFPNKSFFHKAMLKFSLSRAEYIFSTSKAMAEEARKYTRKSIDITPFGVDMEMFSPNKRTRDQSRNGFTKEFIVGTVKFLGFKYGIDYLLKAVARIRREYPYIPIRIHIAGIGTHEEEYRGLAQRLRIDDIVTWHGLISQEQVANEWANMDVGVIVPTDDSESFGISAIEAQACGIPLIVSDIPGLMEATSSGVSSVVIPRKDECALAEAIVKLYKESLLRSEIRISGKRFVRENYEINDCFDKINKLFNDIKEGEKRLVFNESNPFIIGTVKALSNKYGIDILLKAIKIVREKRNDIPVNLRIAGKGDMETELHQLAESLEISEITTWLGFISQEQAAEEWANMDLAVIPSRNESFGVSAVEAQACGTPVIISDIGGLRESTCPGITSICVEKANIEQLADTIIELYDNAEKRANMGVASYCFANEKYELNQCFGRIERLLKKCNKAIR